MKFVFISKYELIDVDDISHITDRGLCSLGDDKGVDIHFKNGESLFITLEQADKLFKLLKVRK